MRPPPTAAGPDSARAGVQHPGSQARERAEHIIGIAFIEISEPVAVSEKCIELRGEEAMLRHQMAAALAPLVHRIARGAIEDHHRLRPFARERVDVVVTIDCYAGDVLH